MRGGARRGAGRPRNPVRKLEGHLADRIFDNFGGEEKAWQELLTKVIADNNLRLWFEILCFLTDHLHGKAPQQTKISGAADAPIQLIVDM